MKLVSLKPVWYSCAGPTTRPAASRALDAHVEGNRKLLLNSSPHAAQSCHQQIPVRINKKWMEYQGIQNWEGLLNPLDESLRAEIIRYGHFVEAAYIAFNSDTSSSTYAMCRHPKRSLLPRTGFPDTGYKVTKNLQATSSIHPPGWMNKAPSWTTTRSSWIGYVSVCTDKDEIARLGRRDVVIALRGTATCLEWIENLRATLTPFPAEDSGMVESGFLSLYTSSSANSPSLRDQVREEIRRLLETYGNSNETISVTLTGHSLGAALAILAAYDIKTTISRQLLVTVISFGGPRVGNQRFRNVLEQQGTKVLRIVNSDDLVTKLPGFVVDGIEDSSSSDQLSGWLPGWVYAEVGRELRLSSRESPDLAGINVATCHELGTYLHLVNGFCEL